MEDLWGVNMRKTQKEKRKNGKIRATSV